MGFMLTDCSCQQTRTSFSFFLLFCLKQHRTRLSLTLLVSMEGLGGLGFGNMSSSVRKKRSNTSRRPWNDSQPHSEFQEVSSLSSTPPSENVSKFSSDDNYDCSSVGPKKEASLKVCSSRASFSNIPEAESSRNMIRAEDGGFIESDGASNNGSFRGSNEERHGVVDSKRFREGVLAPTNWKGSSNLGNLVVITDELGNENKVKKVKLKVGSVTRTISAKSVSDGASAAVSSNTKSSHISDVPRQQQRMIQESFGDNPSFSSDKGSSIQGAPWKDFFRSGSSAGKVDTLREKMPDEDIPTKQTDRYEPLRKSKRVPKRRLVDVDLDDGGEDAGYDDDEIRYPEKIKPSKLSSAMERENEGGSRKHRRISKVLKRNVDSLYEVDASSRLGKEGKRYRSGRVSVDTDYVEEDENEEEAVSDGEPESKRKKARKETVDLFADPKKEMTVTTRQRALQTGKEISSGIAANLIVFPGGLPPAPPRKQKEKLSELEQQLKKAEAAQRRRMQVEKAARESEAEAIRKILGQDSSRKKREAKMKKQQEELAQERAANASILAADTVRWVMGPSGTVVTFPEEVGLPNIFDPKPCSYPPPREKCAGPSCSNPYKYRDSKSNLPLCSLQCYKAVHEKMPSVSAC
ncbi:uncharacterized protein LOC110815346 isoform X1 [Carica papaya]|uniref:uncharacterized protein LOC110815346 isoform X1 n=2 Tax=Carica papaya TaxID=3649 RepID=UPI000B8CCFD6|nr:uncharacterized protein LOC110815346 isoform X1 [Carica papaya]